MPKVSVVVPVYNVERYLSECLESVISQTLSDIEIICVNDGSTDGSGAILGEYAERDPRIIVVEQENQGLAGARNSGLDAAIGEYVLFLDSDDWVEATMIEEVCARCVNDDADIGIFKIRYVYTDTGVSVDGHWTLQMGLVPTKVPFCRDEMSGSLFRFVTPSACNKMFKRSFLLEGGLRFVRGLRRAEDVPFTYLALATAERITVLDRVLLNYRKGVSDSLQSTIHEEPLEICRALAITKMEAEKAGVFPQIERDFTSAALYQCLFTLESVKTVDAFRELYAELKSTYFSELGISDREKDYFLDPRHYDQYVRVIDESADEYLLAEIKMLRSELIDTRAALGSAKEATGKASASLSKMQKSQAYRLGRRLAAVIRRVPAASPPKRIER